MSFDDSHIREILQQCPSPILVTDLKGSIEYVNSAFIQMTGYKENEVIGKNPRILQSGKTPRKVYDQMWNTLLLGEVWRGELCNKRKNGEIFIESIAIAPIRDQQGKITNYIGTWQDITERKWEEEQLVKKVESFKQQSRTDSLTQLYNHGHILFELHREVERSMRYQRPLSGMMLDIDNFKRVNDQMGHLIGDRVLKTFSHVIRKSIRRIDIAGRYGGDEFLIIFPESTIETAELIAKRIQDNVREYQKEVLEESLNVTASIGLLCFDDVKENNEIIFVEKIDNALLEAKKTGKNRIVIG